MPSTPAAFIADGVRTRFPNPLAAPPASVKVNGTTTVITLGGNNEIVFASPPAANALVVVYPSDAEIAGNDAVINADAYIPDHLWVGTTLKFRHPDGTWGSAVNLVGPAVSPTEPPFSTALAAKADIAVVGICRADIPTRTIPFQSFNATGYYAPGDLGQGAPYVRGTSSGPGAIQDAAGTWWNISVANGTSVGWHGAKGDGTTNDSAAFSAAFAATKIVRVGIGTFIANVVVPNGGSLLGTDRARSIIKAPAGASSTAILGYEADVLIGTTTYDNTRGANLVTITNLTVDGNKANVTTAGDGIRIWGYGLHLENLTIQNCFNRGIHTEWTDGAVAMEPTFRNIKIDTCGGHGWLFNGPHDAHVENITILDASQSADRAGYGLAVNFGPVGSYGNGRFYNVHVWHRAGKTNRCALALYSNSAGNQFVGCHFEGTRQLVRLTGDNMLSACLMYACFGANGESMVVLSGNDNLIAGCKFGTSALNNTPNPNGSGAPNPDVYAIYFGSSAGNKIVGCAFMGFQPRTPFHFATSAGVNSIVSCTGSVDSGGATAFAGTPAATDEIDYVQYGTYINFRKPATYSSFASNAAAASGGVPLGGIYMNSSSGALTVRTV